jgi:hypothetical protein
MLDNLRNTGVRQARIGVRKLIGDGPLLERPGRGERPESFGREARREVSPAQRCDPCPMYEDNCILFPHLYPLFVGF